MQLNFKRLQIQGESLSLVVDSVQSINWEVEQITLTNERQISSINGVEKPHLLINLNSILFYYSTTESQGAKPFVNYIFFKIHHIQPLYKAINQYTFPKGLFKVIYIHFNGAFNVIWKSENDFSLKNSKDFKQSSIQKKELVYLKAAKPLIL